MSLSLLVASADESLRELVRDLLLNMPNGRVVNEYSEVSLNLYIRVLQDLERHPDAALIVDISSDPISGIKALEKLRQAVPDIYIIAADYSTDGDSILLTMRSGANDYILMPVKRADLRDAISRLERAPRRHAGSTASQLARVYTFIGTKGGVGTTSLAVNFASVLAQRKQNTVLVDVDWHANDVCMQLGLQPQYTLLEVAENLNRMDQALFEGFVARDPIGFFVVGPPDSLETGRGYFNEPTLREFATFLVEKYNAVVFDAGNDLTDELVQGALQVSSTVFLVITQEFSAVRNAQRYISYLMRLGFTADQIKVVVNRYSKMSGPHVATLEQIQQTLNQAVFYGIPNSPAVGQSINKSRPLVADRQLFPEMDKTIRAFVDKATGGRAAMQKSA